MSRLRLNFSKPHFNWELDLLCWQIIMFSSCCLYQFDCLDYSLIKDQLFFVFKYKGPMMKMLKNEKSRDGGGAKHCDKGTVQNKKYHNLWKKSKKGEGSGSGPKYKKVYISNVDSLWLRGGGLNFSDFSQIPKTEIWPSLNACCLPAYLLPSLILMIYETAIGEIYATFGTYMAYIWMKYSPLSVYYDLGTVWARFRGGATISK